MSASANPYNIVAVAALLREDQDDPVCVVRWALGSHSSTCASLIAPV